MSIFQCLPKINKCCCFSLKTASIMVALLGLLAGLNLLSLRETCKVEQTYMTALKYIWAVIEAMVFITSIILLVGIYMGKRITATLYLYAMSLGLFSHIVFGILSIFEAANKTNCITTQNIISWFIYIPCDILYLIIVRSYREEMGE